MTGEFTVHSRNHAELLDITGDVRKIVAQSGVEEGTCVVYVPHTTAGVTVNENADPTVVADLLHALERAVPWRDAAYRHGEGNSAAHVKSSLVGCSQTIIVRHGRLALGTWQGIYFCEFDGPRVRQVMVRVG